MNLFLTECFRGVWKMGGEKKQVEREGNEKGEKERMRKRKKERGIVEIASIHDS